MKIEITMTDTEDRASGVRRAVLDQRPIKIVVDGHVMTALVVGVQAKYNGQGEGTIRYSLEQMI